MRNVTPLLILLALADGSAIAPTRAAQAPPASITERYCGTLGRAHLRTTLYFGLKRPAGTVTEGQWRFFLSREVTPRFPEGLTVWEANGQWRRGDGSIQRERAKVLLLVHEDTAEIRSALESLIAGYKRTFQQESVLWETAPVCAAF